ncbi:ATP-dependent helicase [Chryseobacterium sp. S0630]|uniref:UvrD-helicase domain-containing protein n=1 Tax=Chryseobacterium sp. S0630 TaxID=2957803 RepID=UPI00209E34A8|nr:ATP-dependent helicase [Chryseobacterium sp. S0630]MCP1297614.1 ATP-dependent helicase [Chryseobacterium sp. S0630]
MFFWEENSLNKDQENAIFEKNSVLLIACPGSGKTRTLTYKMAYELSRLKTKKHFVIAITYTNNAADEIKERVEMLGVDVSQLWIGTIHSFCLEWIINPYHLHLDMLKNGFRVINSYDSETLLTQLCEPYRNERITYWDCGIIAKTDGYHLTCSNRNKHESLKKIYSEYFKTLQQNNQIDFEQILFLAYSLLKQNPIICSILAKLFPFILIDEYQDTKEIQYHIISQILKANNGDSKTLIVGDPNQSIYQSLGGYAMPQKELEELFGFKLIELGLTHNYRSSQSVINYFDYYKTFPNTIIASGEHKDYPSTITFNFNISLNDLVKEISRLILINIKEKKISPNEICIVAPQWAHIASITRRLMIELPNLSFDGPGMAPFSRDIENFWFKVSRIVLTEPSPHLYVRRMRWSKEVLDTLEAAGIDISNLTPKLLLKICNSIEIDENNGLAYLRFFFDEICNKLAIQLDNYSLLKEHYISFFESSEQRINKLIREGHTFIGDIDNFRKVFKQKEGITVSTIHGVKGEEYDTMIGFALLDDYVPHFSDQNKLESSKKLLYVLASRARKNLHIISERERAVDYRNPHGKAPTPYLLTYDFKYNIL